MGEKTEQIRQKLKSTGFSDEVVRAVWPQWWSEDAELSPSALNDLKFSVSRRLGLNPTSLFDEGDATFVWRGSAKFKGFKAQSSSEKIVLNAFGASVARSLLAGREKAEIGTNLLAEPDRVRQDMLDGGIPYVRLVDLVHLSWGLGIPVIQMRIFPLMAKRMAAMTVRLGDRYAILIGRDSLYPATLAFVLAHELGHIACGHLPENTSLIDRSVIGHQQLRSDDDEEAEADRFALTMLTGNPAPVIEPTRLARNSTELFHSAKTAAPVERIEPGTLALCYAYKLGAWQIGNGALKILYAGGTEVWRRINSTAEQALSWDNFSSDTADFVGKILGLSQNAEHST